MKRVWLLIIALSAFGADTASGQLQIRQSFGAAASVGKPAALLWTAEKAPDDVSFGTIDLGVRYSFDIVDAGLEIIGGPTVEWHKLTRDEKEHDRYSGGAALEFIINPVRIPWAGSPVVTTEGAYEHDRIEDDGGFSGSAAATFYSNSAWAPGKQNVLWPGSMLRYYPAAGVERHANVIESASASTSFGKIDVEFWPIRRFQALANYTYRSELGGNVLPDDLDWFSISANAYFDSQSRFGVGVEYVKGAQPDEAFSQVERMVVGFKVKI